MFTEEDKSNNTTEEDLEEEVKEEPKEEEKEDNSQELEELRNKVKEQEKQLEAIRKEADKKILEFVEKKTKEATEIIQKKEKELIEKYKLELENNKKYVYESQFSTLAEIVSQFENVINLTTDPAVVNYLVGFKMFISQLNELLSDLGITSIEPELNSEFDSEIMEVVSVKTVDDEKLDNKIVKLISKGYKLYGRIIKLAKVEVSKFE